MARPVALNRKIVDFLISLPNINDSDGRKALVFRAVLDTQLQGQIRFSEPPAHFFELLVPQLVQYGQLEDGRNALEAVLESAKNFVGQPRRAYCENLIKQLRAVSNGENYSPSTPSFFSVQLLLEGNIQDFNEQKHQNLTEVISTILDIEKESVRILHVKPATSFHVIVELPGESALELVALFKTKDKRAVSLLRHFSVKSINIAEGEELLSYQLDTPLEEHIDFHQKIQHIERLLYKGEFTDSAMRGLIMIELVLRHIVTQYIANIEEAVRTKIQVAVQKYDRYGKGIEGLTMGQIVQVVHESKFLDALMNTLGTNLESLTIIDLERLTQLRNKFIYEGQEASSFDAELLLRDLKAFLTVFEIDHIDSRRSSVKRILLLTANPEDIMRIRIDEEEREIVEGLQRSQNRERFIIHQQWAVRLRDLRRAMLDHEPQFVHFSGHGEKRGIMVEDDSGHATIVTPDALSGLFELFADRIECVLLNACYSESQAQAINKYVEYVIGIPKGIQDNVAIEFTIGFYDALGAGKSIEEAFNFGCNAFQAYNIPQHFRPLLKRKLNSSSSTTSDLKEQSTQGTLGESQRGKFGIPQNTFAELETKRLRQKFEHLQQLWEIVTQKVEELESHKLLATRVEEKIRIEALITEHIQKQKQIEQELHEIKNHNL